MMTAQEALLVAGMAAVTFLVRWPVLALVSRVNLPGPVLDGMKFIPQGSRFSEPLSLGLLEAFEFLRGSQRALILQRDSCKERLQLVEVGL